MYQCVIMKRLQNLHVPLRKNVKIENQSNFIHRAYKATPSQPFETDSCFPSRSTWNGIELYCRLMRQSFNALCINFGREQGQQFIETGQSNSGHAQAYCSFMIILCPPSFYVFENHTVLVVCTKWCTFTLERNADFGRRAMLLNAENSGIPAAT